MKVVLLKDVSGVGQKGMVKEVADGFAQNSLIPRKAAEIATPERLTLLEKEKKSAAAVISAMESKWKEQARLLQKARVTVRTDANEKGQLYRQLPIAAIVERVKKELGVTIEEKEIISKVPIKSLGRADVDIKLGKRRIPLTVFIERSSD